MQTFSPVGWIDMIRSNWPLLGAGLCLGGMIGVVINFEHGAAAGMATPDNGPSGTSGPIVSEVGSNPARALPPLARRLSSEPGEQQCDDPGLYFLLASIAEVESGSSGGDAAYNPAEDARGRYQIRPAYWQDAMEWLGKDWPHTDAHDPAKARQAVLWYWARYGAKTDEERARIHNGGPRWREYKDTITYWAKVKAAMRKED